MSRCQRQDSVAHAEQGRGSLLLLLSALPGGSQNLILLFPALVGGCTTTEERGDALTHLLVPGSFHWFLEEAFQRCLFHAHLCSLAGLSTVFLDAP